MRRQNLTAIPLLAAVIAAALGGCASQEEQAWDSFSSVMDGAFGEGAWTAQSHAYEAGILTVKGVSGPVPPDLSAYLEESAKAGAADAAAAKAASAAVGTGGAEDESPAAPDAPAALPPSDGSSDNYPEAVPSADGENEASETKPPSAGDPSDAAPPANGAADKAPGAAPPPASESGDSERRTPAGTDSGGSTPPAGGAADEATESTPPAGGAADEATESSPPAGGAADETTQSSPPAGPGIGEDSPYPPSAGDEDEGVTQAAPPVDAGDTRPSQPAPATEAASSSAPPAESAPAEAESPGSAPPAESAPAEAESPGSAPPAESAPAEAGIPGSAPPAESAPAEAGSPGSAPPAESAPAEAGSPGSAPPAESAPAEAGSPGSAPPAESAPAEAGSPGSAPPAESAPAEAGSPGSAPPAESAPAEAGSPGSAPPAESAPAAEAGLQEGAEESPPAALKPGFVIGTVKISGIASRALLTSVLFGSGSGSQTKLFDKIEIYDLQLATPSEGTVASLVADFPRLAISGVSCAPAIPGAGPECFAKSLDFGPTASLAVRFPEDDPRLLLNLRAETFHAEDSALGGTPGRSPGAFRAAKAQAQGFRAEMALKGPGTVAAVSLAELSAENLDGLWRAGQTAAKELSVSLFAPGGLDWKARAAFFSAAGLDLRDSLAGPASLPGATDLLNLEIPGSLLPGAVWPSWESLLADRYSADSWRAEGFSAEGPYGGKLSAKALAASGPFSKGKISSTSFEAEGFRAEFQVYAWSHALLEFASRFMGEAVLEGNLKASKDYSPEEGNLRLRLDSLEVNSLGKFSLDVTLSGVKEPLLRSLAAIPLSGLEDPLSAAVSQDVGVGAFELTVSGRPVVDKAVLMTADALDVSPSAARAEMTSKIATTLLFLLGPYAETGSILGISDSLIDFVNAPGTLTLKMEPKSPITSRSVPQEGFEPAELISILNISVASNGNEPARLTP